MCFIKIHFADKFKCFRFLRKWRLKQEKHAHVGAAWKPGLQQTCFWKPHDMSEAERYPPPDFSCPPASSSQPLLQPPRFSGFHPGMWSWTESPCEPSRVGPGWHHQEPAPSFGFQPGWGNSGHAHPYRELNSQEFMFEFWVFWAWHQTKSGFVLGPNFGNEWYQRGRSNNGPPYQPWKKVKIKKANQINVDLDVYLWKWGLMWVK